MKVEIKGEKKLHADEINLDQHYVLIVMPTHDIILMMKNGMEYVVFDLTYNTVDCGSIFNVESYIERKIRSGALVYAFDTYDDYAEALRKVL